MPMRWLPALALIAACNGPEYVTAQGVEVYYNDVRPERVWQIDPMLDALAVAFADRTGVPERKALRALEQDTMLGLYDEPITCCDGVPRYGAYWGPNVVHVWLYTPCLARTAIAHEFGHVLSDRLLGDEDRHHANPAVWAAVGDAIKWTADAFCTGPLIGGTDHGKRRL